MLEMAFARAQVVVVAVVKLIGAGGFGNVLGNGYEKETNVCLCPSSQEPLPTLQYTDFAAFHAERQPQSARLVAFWRQQLHNAPPLPLSVPSGSIGGRVQCHMDEADTAAMEQQWEGLATPYTMVLSAFFTLLHRCLHSSCCKAQKAGLDY